MESGGLESEKKDGFWKFGAEIETELLGWELGNFRTLWRFSKMEELSMGISYKKGLLGGISLGPWTASETSKGCFLENGLIWRLSGEDFSLGRWVGGARPWEKWRSVPKWANSPKSLISLLVWGYFWVLKGCFLGKGMVAREWNPLLGLRKGGRFPERGESPKRGFLREALREYAFPCFG